MTATFELTAFFELMVAPVAVAIAFRHASRALGVRRAALEMSAVAVYGFTLEVVAMAVFGSHHYSEDWMLAPLGVPVAVALVWSAVIVAAMAVAWRYGAPTLAARAAAAALAAATLDMMIEPVAVGAGLWTWTPPGPWLGVPIGNFVGWGIIVGAYGYGAERWAGGEGWTALTRRAALAAGCIALLVAVGLVWTRLGLERAFENDRGWIVWVAVSLGAVSCRWWPFARPQVPHSLPERLAATPGRGPQAVLLVVGVGFLIGARFAGGGDEMAVVCAGSLLAVRTVAAVRRDA